MRVTLDSNAWEAIFEPSISAYACVRDAFRSGRLEGYICDAALRIEAVKKSGRAKYFAQPYANFRLEGIEVIDGKKYFKASFGPEDEKHPGLPTIQASRLKYAFDHGVRLLRGFSWMGLPIPKEISDSTLYFYETPEAFRLREQTQVQVYASIDARGVGRAAFIAAGGWASGDEHILDEKRLSKGCAEWSDGELVCAHVAYGNEMICTNDHGRGAGKSILDLDNRDWLASNFSVRFVTPDDLLAAL